MKRSYFPLALFTVALLIVTVVTVFYFLITGVVAIYNNAFVEFSTSGLIWAILQIVITLICSTIMKAVLVALGDYLLQLSGNEDN